MNKRKKSAAAVALGKARMKKMTAEERKQIAASGGRAAWANIPAAERSRIMSERRRGKGKS